MIQLVQVIISLDSAHVSEGWAKQNHFGASSSTLH